MNQEANIDTNYLNILYLFNPKKDYQYNAIKSDGIINGKYAFQSNATNRMLNLDICERKENDVMTILVNDPHHASLEEKST